MKKITLISRILLGLMLIVFGLNKFLQFMPMPAMAEPAQAFMGALVATGYVMIIVAVVEIIAGILIMVNKFSALALVVLFPIMLNAFLFHLFLDIAGIGGSLLAMVLIIYLLFVEKDKFAEMLKV